MRIAIFTEQDYTFMFPEWVKLVGELQNAGHSVVGFYLFPTKLGRNTGIRIPLYYLRVFGFFTFLKLAAAAIVSRIRQLLGKAPVTYRGLAKKYAVTMRYGKNPNNPEVIAWVKSNAIDVVIISFGFIVKSPLIEAARVAVINKHSALLPACRGLFPVFWALLHHLPVGVTVHKVDSGIDTGEILYQKEYHFPDYRSVFQYYKKIYSDLSSDFFEAINILDGKKSKQSFPAPLSSSYFGLPDKQDYYQLKSKKLRFI